MKTYLVLKSEVKIGRRGELEYVQEDVISNEVYSDKAREVLKSCVEKTLENGYFDKIVRRTSSEVLLHNGGTVYMHFSIIEVD